ncbi:MAG: hypothetical protein WCA77_01055 [Thermoplasmata archaeon]
MPPKGKPAKSRPHSKKSTAAPPVTETLFAAEDVGAVFEEACDHVAQRPEHRHVVLGTLVEVPMSDLEPGTIGWSRSVRWGEPQDPQPPQGRLYYVMVPSPKRDGDDRPDVFQGRRWTDFARVERIAGPPPTILAGWAATDVAVPLVRKFTEAVRDELLGEAN